MKDEHKIWWLELADWYEKFADKGTGRTPTCSVLTYDTYADFGFSYTDCHNHAAWKYLRHIWRYWGERSRIELDYPCGDFYNHGDEVAAKRKEFCYWMADTIRNAVEEGIYPWEDK
jgi:flavin-dependent dehydrogenase